MFFHCTRFLKFLITRCSHFSCSLPSAFFQLCLSIRFCLTSTSHPPPHFPCPCPTSPSLSHFPFLFLRSATATWPPTSRCKCTATTRTASRWRPGRTDTRSSAAIWTARVCMRAGQCLSEMSDDGSHNVVEPVANRLFVLS